MVVVGGGAKLTLDQGLGATSSYSVVKYYGICFRLLAQGLVLNADVGRGTGSLGAVAELREDEDEAYFSSYGHYSIHEEMLKVRYHNGMPAHMHTLMPSSS